MCFSAEASFAASGALATVGALSFGKAKSRRMRWLAFVPILFSVQQAIEGFQWLVEKPGTLSTILGYAFLTFAFLVWLILIPFVDEQIEPKTSRRKWFRILTWVGAGCAGYLLYFLLTKPLTVCVTGHHIDYQIDIHFPFFAIGLAVYVFITCGSMLLSSRPMMRLFGALAFLSLLVTVWAYQETLTSVWCFFAAALSTLVYLEIARDAKKHKGFWHRW